MFEKHAEQNAGSRKWKVLLIFLAVVVISVLGAAGYEHFYGRYDREWAAQVLEDYGMTFHNLKSVQFPRKKAGIPHFKYLTDKEGGAYAYDEKYLYPVALNPEYEIKNIDFATLKATESQDIIGYIEFENNDIISYPVFYQAGTEYYLTHTRTGAESVAAEIYVEGLIYQGHSRTNTIIYGHNMRNRSMFGSLREYKSAEYFPGHEFFWYYRPSGKYRYQIFSVYETRYDSNTFSWFPEPSPEYTAWLNQMNRQTYYDTGIQANPTDEVITLCTCTSKGGEYRLVLQARMIYKDES